MAITPVVNTDPVSPLENLFNTQATALEAEMAAVSAGLAYKSTADLASLHGLTATQGLTYVVTEGGALFVGNGTVFVQVTKATFASTTARDTAYAKASGVYKLSGVLALDTSTGITSRYNTTLTAWRLWESDWIAYTPTLANVTIGTAGVSTFKYRYGQGSVQVSGAIKLGTSGASMGSLPTFTLPVASATPAHNFVILFGGSRLYDDSATQNYIASVVASTASTTVALIQSQTGTAGVAANITSAAPFTWAAADAIDIDATYEPA